MKARRFILPQDRPIPGSSQEWLARAKGDLALASASLPEGGFYEDLCFHAQQAAEKAIKSIYLHHKWNFRYIHDLGELINELRDNGISVPPELEEAVILTNYAFETRYPGLGEPVTQDDCKQAVKLSERVVRWAETQMRE